MAPVGGGQAVTTDHWFYGLFQSAPDLITLLLPSAAGPAALPVPSLAADAPGDVLYRFEAPELKAANHRLDGALWPRGSEGVDMTPIAGPVLLRAGGWSGRSPLLEDLQGRTPLERRMRSVGVVLHPVLLCQPPGFWH